MIDLPQLILCLRPDLQKLFSFGSSVKQADWWSWLVITGKNEYPGLIENSFFLQKLQERDPVTGLTRLQLSIYRSRHDLQGIFNLSNQQIDFVIWFYTHGVGEHDLWPLLSDSERYLALQIAEEIQSPWLGYMRRRLAVTILGEPNPAAARPFGVNLIGYAFGQLGIGEDLRMTALALQTADIPFTVVNFPPGDNIPQNDRTMEPYIEEEGKYFINLFCLTAEETGRFYAEHGIKQFSGRYNIGYWPWELSKWPKEWQQIHSLVDEAWVSSQHIYDALRPSFNKPIHIMPLVVAPEPNAEALRKPETRRHTRRRFGLPTQTTLFCFAFDLSSSIHRKNPETILQAFLQAFPSSETRVQKVGLVIKAHAPRTPHRGWQRLKNKAGQDTRIHIIEDTLSRQDLMTLYAACDAFVSLHRAEGFGRGIAEALQLGLHVIATNYGGNIDFCRRPEFGEQVSMVDYRMVKIKPHHYPHSQDQMWANPSVSAAAQAMRRFIKVNLEQMTVSNNGWPCFSPQILGKLYAQRLLKIYALFVSVNKTDL